MNIECEYLKWEKKIVTRKKLHFPWNIAAGDWEWKDVEGGEKEKN